MSYSCTEYIEWCRELHLLGIIDNLPKNEDEAYKLIFELGYVQEKAA